MWPNTETGSSKLRVEDNGARKGSQSSTTTPDSAESGDDEDILGLISSSLDSFNAQLHHHTSYTSQSTSLPIPLNRSDIPVQDIGPALPTTNFSNSILSTWTPLGKTQDLSNSPFAYPSTTISTATGNLQQKSLPSPPGLPRLNQALQSSSAITTAASTASSISGSVLKPIGSVESQQQRKQRSVSQTFSDSDEASPLWDSRWKVLPSEMAMLSVDSGIDGGDLYLMPNWFSNGYNSNAVNTVSSASSCSTSAGGCIGNGGPGKGECCNGGSTFPSVLNGGNFSPAMDSFPLNSQFQSPPSASQAPPPAPQSFEFPTFDATLINQAAVLAAAAAAQVANDTSKGHQPLQPSSDLRSFLWPPPSWPNATDSSLSTESPQMHFRSGDNHQQLISRFEVALRQQQQQQQSRHFYNRRKADSICFSSAARLNSGLLAPTSNATAGSNGMKSNIGQLGSPPPPGDLCCQQMSKSYLNTPQKFTKDFQRPFGKSSSSVLGAPKTGQRGVGGTGRTKRTEKTSSFSSSSSTSSAETSSDKPVIAKWRRACSFYLRGHCKKEDCEFAHDLTKVTCKFWEVGECFKGPTCPFLHGYPPELLLEVQQSQQQQEQHPQHQVEQLAGK